MKQDKEKPETSSPAEEQKTQVSESAKTKEKAPTTESRRRRLLKSRRRSRKLPNRLRRLRSRK